MNKLGNYNFKLFFLLLHKYIFFFYFDNDFIKCFLPLQYIHQQKVKKTVQHSDPLDLRLIFKYLIHKIDFWPWFFVYLFFTARVACKNPVSNKQEIKFKNQVCKLEISRIKCNSTRGHFKSKLLKECRVKCLEKHEMHTLDVQINKTSE